MRSHRHGWRFIKRFYNDKIHFLQLHYLYILLVAFIGSFSFYFQPGTKWNYIDALFMSTSSVTNSGLNTITMSDVSTWQLVVIYLSSCLGSHIVISIIIVYVRKHYFSKRFEDILIYNKAQLLRETNKRKFEKHIREMERRNSKEYDNSNSLRKRFSFISVRSAHKMKDLEDNDPSIKLEDTKPPSPPIAHISPQHTINANDDQFSSSFNTCEAAISEIKTPIRVINSSHTDGAVDNNSIIRSNSDNSLIRTNNQSELINCPNYITRSLMESSSNNSNRSSTQEDNNAPNKENIRTMSSSQGIAFANNIERQREVARKRLLQERKFDDRMSQDFGSASATKVNSQTSFGQPMEPESDEEMNRIMRGPIHKSELSKEHRYRLGGAEYRAIVFLTRLVPFYYLFCVIGFGFLVRIYVAMSTYAQEVLQTSNGSPVDPWFFSFFLSMSSFNNLGMSLLNASMVPFQSAAFLLLINMFLILAGNTAYAIVLRIIIWGIYKLTPRTHMMHRETLRYLLDHPRRCYTTLFPASHTMWLFIVLVCITTAEFVSFIALNYWLPVLEGIDWGARILDGLFQSVATRNAGYSVVDLSALNPGTQLVYIVAMYISAYPVAISMRNSNVYQERALGIYGGKNDDDSDDVEPEASSSRPVHRLKRQTTLNSIMTTSKKVLRKPDFFVMTQIQRQLTSEIGWVVCIIILVCVVEWEPIMSPSPITIASVIYECVSAFGGVGASYGYPNTTASQSQQYRTLSKLLLIILMYRGRHRGLPAAIDRAVLLPSETLEQKEQEDHLLRRNTLISVDDESGGTIVFYNRCRTL